MADTTENTTTTTSTGCLVTIDANLDNQSIFVFAEDNGKDRKNKFYKVLKSGDTIPSTNNYILYHLRAKEGYSVGKINQDWWAIKAEDKPLTIHLDPATPIPEGEEAVVLDGSKRFNSIADAMEYVDTEVVHTIEVKKDIPKERGFVIKENTKLIINLNFHTVTFYDQFVGSQRTESNCIQALKGSIVTINNGKLVVSKHHNPEVNKWGAAKICIQNYSKLTLNNTSVDTSNNKYTWYCVSNNYGEMNLKGNSNINPYPGDTAFDCWFGLNKSYLDKGPKITIDESFTGTINGRIEYGSQIPEGKTTDGTPWRESATIEINAPKGNFNTKLVESSAGSLTEDAGIKLKNGNFSSEMAIVDSKGNVVKGLPTQYMPKDKKTQTITDANGNISYKVVDESAPSSITGNSLFGPTILHLFEMQNMR